MAKRGPQPKTGKMEPPAYKVCETVPDPPDWLSDIGRAEWTEKAEELRARDLVNRVPCDARLVLRHLRVLPRANRFHPRAWQQLYKREGLASATAGSVASDAESEVDDDLYEGIRLYAGITVQNRDCAPAGRNRVSRQAGQRGEIGVGGLGMACR